MQQISIFDGVKPVKIIKPIRLITLFSGYDSQALSLKYLGVPFEHYHTCEWAIKSIQALKDLHFGYDNGDYSVGLSKDDLVDILVAKGVSADYNKPLTKEQLSRYPETKLRTIYNNIVATRNLVSICNINGKDLDICDTDKYEYIMTYSFPCQDLSSAGKGAGMEKENGTRSSLLWEVERLLKETKELPQVLLMENVPEVIGSKNIKHFAKWIEVLDNIGYRSKWGLLNAKDFGIAQNRNRCFMVSVLGNYYYNFPKTVPLTLRLKDISEKGVDKKYYLSDKQLVYAFDCNRVCDNTKRGDLGNRKVNPQIAKTISCRGAESQRADITNFVVEDNSIEYTLGEVRNIINLKRELCNNLIKNGLVEESDIIWTDLRIRKFTPKECWRLMGIKDEDYEKVAKNQSNASCYHLAGDSIVTTVLMAIFGQMFDVNWKEKINELAEELTNGQTTAD